MFLVKCNSSMYSMEVLTFFFLSRLKLGEFLIVTQFRKVRPRLCLRFGAWWGFLGVLWFGDFFFLVVFFLCLGGGVPFI